MASNYVQNCPRCTATNSTFDVLAQNSRGFVRHWVEKFEIYCVCRACKKGTVFLIENKVYDLVENWQEKGLGIVNFRGVLNEYFNSRGYINLSDLDVDQPPEHTPEPIANIFFEGSKCLTIGCWNAAGAMFRTSIDVATKSLLPELGEDEDNNLKSARKFLFHRLRWLIENGKIPPELGDLADCIREDGNDGVHDANLSEEDALDLKDFATEMFERLYTTPHRLNIARERRSKRREPKAVTD